ncbi:MAG: transketolase [Clostridiales bacterium]|nr:transketolase [Clostridiales bacterium]
MNISEKTINTIRVLSADMVQKAKSGHPGAPMGMAPMAYTLWAQKMNHNPYNPQWANRDRFVLSAGHASALIYSLLHLFDYGLSMDEIKRFRQWGSQTPGHPEYGHTVGVETTTGPLGQGIANGVGFAIAETMLADKFNQEGFSVVDHYTYVIAGDGCMMEGISSEAASLAGTLQLGKLIVLYDSNDITIEGNTNIAMREDVAKRFEAYGWHVVKVEDGTNVQQIADAVEKSKKDERPSLIVVPTVIGYGCKAKAGTSGAHGEPLGEENLAETKRFLGMKEEAFYVDQEVYAHTQEAAQKGAKKEEEWNALFEAYAKAHPQLAKEWEQWFSNQLSQEIFQEESYWDFPDSIATRNASYDVINRLADKIPNLVGGSADLAPSTKTLIKNASSYSAENRGGRNLHFGVREHAMAAISNGIALHGGLRVYCATFFVFSDYMKNAIRMSAIMKAPVTYVLTHDSIGVGEDGPTHQPIEQLAGLRAIPDLLVVRPADGKETAAGWMAALTKGLPTCLVLTRQNLPKYEKSGIKALQGGYILSDSQKQQPDVLLMGSGSEMEILVSGQKLLAEEGIDARVISIPSMELFELEGNSYKEEIMPIAIRARVSAEAGVDMPWYKYIGLDGKTIGINHFGASAPAEILFKEFGFTPQEVVNKAKSVLHK